MSKLRTANLLGALAGEVSTRLDRQLKAHPNQTTSSAAALNINAYFEGCSNSELAKALGLSHPATVRLVDKLEAEGLVEARDAKDGRAVALFLTQTGEARARAILQHRCLALSALIEVLPEDEQAQFSRALEKILASLTGTIDQAVYICRLCDEMSCPQDVCPVHQRALRLESGRSPGA